MSHRTAGPRGAVAKPIYSACDVWSAALRQRRASGRASCENNSGASRMRMSGVRIASSAGNSERQRFVRCAVLGSYLKGKPLHSVAADDPGMRLLSSPAGGAAPSKLCIIAPFCMKRSSVNSQYHSYGRPLPASTKQEQWPSGGCTGPRPADVRWCHRSP
ncbi:hypothetical protein EVAR_22604_1 [Eumeta japonica]|uniref:Uncharacterized protein n=1 Tax=Eumeta variegata TaxID=151549 RepID=A0A4C1U7P5_EUMVA|nr:hypothetical protein EVAR_22604_1 [Eumeta japonica]